MTREWVNENLAEYNPAQDWSLVDELVDGQTLGLYRNAHGDEIEVRDTYNRPVQLSTEREDRYEVIMDSKHYTPIFGAHGSFARPQDAFEYAVETLMDEELSEDWVPEMWKDVALDPGYLEE